MPKKIENECDGDYLPGEFGPWIDAAYYLKKFLRFDGDRYALTADRRISPTMWEFTVSARDGSRDIYFASNRDGAVSHVRHEPYC